jgi:hypothetical protein
MLRNSDVIQLSLETYANWVQFTVQLNPEGMYWGCFSLNGFKSDICSRNVLKDNKTEIIINHSAK